MKLMEHCKFAAISLLLATALAACDKPGPAETAGKKIDQTADSAAIRMGQAANKVGEKLDEQSAKTGAAMGDAEITAKVKASIFAEPGLRTLQISVDTLKGMVTLTGSADSPQSSNRAKELAAAVAGVKGVDNRVVAKLVQ
jgi:osmotically-inducible protein OsmY